MEISQAMSTLAHLTTEGRNPASEAIDRMSALEIVRLINAEDATVAAAVAREAEAIGRAIEVIADRLHAGGRLVYAGAGTSGRLGVLDATECPPTFNTPPGQVIGLIAGGPHAMTRSVEGAEDRPELAAEDLKSIGLTARDVFVGIATSGRTPYVLGGLAYAKAQGAYAIGVACNRDASLIPYADLAITPIVGPEVVSGSTRMKAGTATKMVLNMLSTGAMVLLGKTYGNLMVDLQATNSKLVERSRRIVAELAGRSPDEAERALSQCDGEVKTAIVVLRCSIPAEEARARLRRAGGHLRRALDGTPDEELMRARLASPDHRARRGSPDPAENTDRKVSSPLGSDVPATEDRETYRSENGRGQETRAQREVEPPGLPTAH
jgi:N-acetylmuramic acid 6-phosphate etherase